MGRSNFVIDHSDILTRFQIRTAPDSAVRSESNTKNLSSIAFLVVEIRAHEVNAHLAPENFVFVKIPTATAINGKKSQRPFQRIWSATASVGKCHSACVFAFSTSRETKGHQQRVSSKHVSVSFLKMMCFAMMNKIDR